MRLGVVVLGTLGLLLLNPGGIVRDEDRYDSLFQFYAEENGFTGKDWLRFKAQVAQESSFNPQAVSPVGAVGLAQFMAPTWKDWGEGKDRNNPEASIKAQIRYMKWLLDRVTTWERAWAAYNWGIGNLLKLGNDAQWKLKLPLETREYIYKVDKYYEEYWHGRRVG